MATYLERLKHQAAEYHARRAEERARRLRPLHEKIREWYESQQAHSRKASYTMEELVILFGTSPGLIGTALHRLSWERKRRWNSGGAFTRYWVPRVGNTACSLTIDTNRSYTRADDSISETSGVAVSAK